jgi:hypothetical protein
MIWGHYGYYLQTKYERDSIQVVYDKGRDNDATLRSKLVSAFRKTGTDMARLNEYLQTLKKKKSVQVYY